jgi:hypothetical protein
MKSNPVQRHNGHRASPGTTALLLMSFSLLAACETPQERVEHHEDNLAAAGFIVRPANTPEREAMLKRLPPNKFVQRAKGDTVDYVYADPLVCNCLYVGTQQAYNQYKQHQQQQNLADEQLLTADTYADSTWSWGAWGPWPGPYGLRYGDGFGW